MNNQNVLSQQQIAAFLHESSEAGSVHLKGSMEERRAQFRAMRAADREREGMNVGKDHHFSR
jgi:hypothetical protein